MEWVAWILFEKPLALAAVLFTVNFALLVYWRRRGRPRPLLIGLAAAAVLLIVQALVVTRREHAIRLLRPIEQNVVAGRTDALAAALAAQFETAGMGPQRFIEYVQHQYEKIRVHGVNCSSLRITDSQPERFVVTARYQVDVTVHDFSGILPTTWQIVFVRTEPGWRIAGVRATYIAGLPDPSWRAIDDF